LNGHKESSMCIWSCTSISQLALKNLLRWSSDGGRSYREIVRQQYNFSPPDTTAEREDYYVDPDGVTNVELTIIPAIGGGAARATLAQLCLA